MGLTKYIEIFLLFGHSPISQFIIKRELVDEEPSLDFNLILTNKKKSSFRQFPLTQFRTNINVDVEI